MGTNSIATFKTNIEKRISRQISKDFKKVCEQLIKDFYSSYSPTKYHRIENYKYNVLFSPVRGKKVGGVRVNCNMHDYYKYTKQETGEVITYPGENVFFFIWMKGIRGLPATGKSGWTNPFYMTTFYEISDFNISGRSPDDIMNKMIENWDTVKSGFVDQVYNSELEKLDLFSLL